MVGYLLTWIAVGAISGGLVTAARWGFVTAPIGWGRPWALNLAVGVGAAVLGGWLGGIIFGPFAATPTAIWLNMLIVVVGPWTVQRIRQRRAPTAKAPTSP